MNPASLQASRVAGFRTKLLLAIMLLVPGAMEAGLSDPLFWGSLVVSLVLAGAAAFPLNRWLIARGQGHAVVHAHH